MFKHLRNMVSRAASLLMARHSIKPDVKPSRTVSAPVTVKPTTFWRRSKRGQGVRECARRVRNAHMRDESASIKWMLAVEQRRGKRVKAIDLSGFIRKAAAPPYVFDDIQ